MYKWSMQTGTIARQYNCSASFARKPQFQHLSLLSWSQSPEKTSSIFCWKAQVWMHLSWGGKGLASTTYHSLTFSPVSSPPCLADPNAISTEQHSSLLHACLALPYRTEKIWTANCFFNNLLTDSLHLSSVSFTHTHAHTHTYTVHRFTLHQQSLNFESHYCNPGLFSVFSSTTLDEVFLSLPPNLHLVTVVFSHLFLIHMGECLKSPFVEFQFSQGTQETVLFQSDILYSSSCPMSAYLLIVYLSGQKMSSIRAVLWLTHCVNMRSLKV